MERVSGWKEYPVGKSIRLVKVKVFVQRPDLYAILIRLPFPKARIARNATATIDPTLNLCTRYPLLLGGQRQCGFKACPRLLHLTGASTIEPQTPRYRVPRSNRSATHDEVGKSIKLVINQTGNGRQYNQVII